MNANKRLKTAMCVVFMFYLTVNVFGKPVSESLFWKACCVKELRKLEMLLIAFKWRVLHTNRPSKRETARGHFLFVCVFVCSFKITKTLPYS